jgi:hypothetical protein
MLTEFTSTTNQHPSPFLTILLQALREKHQRETFLDIFNHAQFQLSSSPLNFGRSGQWAMKTPGDKTVFLCH